MTENIQKCIYELFVIPMQTYYYWGKITNQTEHPSLGYAAQHLASLITKQNGARSAARGKDIEDGSEVKLCCIVGQIDVCKDCKAKVYKSETSCRLCNSTKIQRNKDSKWIFNLTTQEEVDNLCNSKKILLFLIDYPDFSNNNFKTISFKMFEILPTNTKHKKFKEIMQQYYDSIYTKNKKAGKKPAPKNFWPYSYQFYLTLPILTFHAEIDNVYIANMHDIVINRYILPEVNREELEVMLMPRYLVQKKSDKSDLMTIEEISLLPLRGKEEVRPEE